MSALLSVVIVTYQSGPEIRRCLTALLPSLPAGTGVVVVDNASPDGSAAGLDREFPDVQLILNPRNTGFGAACNTGANALASELVLFLNPDTEVAPDAIATALAWMAAHPDTGILGADIRLPDGTSDRNARRRERTALTYVWRFTKLDRVFKGHRVIDAFHIAAPVPPRPLDVASTAGAFMLVRREALTALGGFDERFFMYSEDEDLCQRARSGGWRVVWHPGVVVHHVRGASTSQRPLRMAWHRNLSLARYHRIHLAHRYPMPVNALVYAGIWGGLAMAATGYTARRILRAPRPASPADITKRPDPRRLERGVKRLMDIAGAALLLVLLSPLMLFIAILVKAGDGGPVFYRWPVVVKDGRHIRSWKFRTMVPDADARHADLLARNEMSGPVFKLTDDPRVTKTGRVLRKYSLDELPQLLSVLAGDLSLVGPRPPLHREYALFTPAQKRKLAVKPGITCLWQVSGRNNISDFDDWLALDLEYIDRWSLGLDISILLRTIPAVLSAKGAK